jgi:hypothetical protein
MTTTTTIDDRTNTTSRTPLLIALGVGGSAVLTAIGTFYAGDDHSASDWFFTVGVVVVAAALVFGLVVRTAARGNPGRRSAVVGVVAVLSLAVFWAGLPVVLAAAAVACALTDKDAQGFFGTPSKVGLGLAALATVGAVILAFVG